MLQQYDEIEPSPVEMSKPSTGALPTGGQPATLFAASFCKGALLRVPSRGIAVWWPLGSEPWNELCPPVRCFLAFDDAVLGIPGGGFPAN